LQTKIPHSLSCIEEDDIVNVKEVMKSGYLKNGHWVKQLQMKVANDINMSFSVITFTGSLAIFLALKLLELPRSAKVILPAYICKSVTTAIRMSGAIPLFCDVSFEDCSLDLKSVNKKLDHSVTTIIIAHLFGNIANVEKFTNFSVPIIEDAAQAPGGQNLGKYSDMLIFSFEGTKMLCAGEGGILAFKSDKLAKLLKERLSRGDICSLTTTDIQASVALSQWNKREIFIKKRRLLAQNYDHAFFPHGIRRFGNQDSLFSRYVIKDCLNVDEMIIKASKENIQLRKPIDPEAIATPNWKEFPVTKHLVSSNLSVPIYPSLTEKAQNQIINFVLKHIKI